MAKASACLPSGQSVPSISGCRWGGGRGCIRPQLTISAWGADPRQDTHILRGWPPPSPWPVRLQGRTYPFPLHTRTSSRPAFHIGDAQRMRFSRGFGGRRAPGSAGRQWPIFWDHHPPPRVQPRALPPAGLEVPRPLPHDSQPADKGDIFLRIPLWAAPPQPSLPGVVPRGLAISFRGHPPAARDKTTFSLKYGSAQVAFSLCPRGGWVPGWPAPGLSSPPPLWLFHRTTQDLEENTTDTHGSVYSSSLRERKLFYKNCIYLIPYFVPRA